MISVWVNEFVSLETGNEERRRKSGVEFRENTSERANTRALGYRRAFLLTLLEMDFDLVNFLPFDTEHGCIEHLSCGAFSVIRPGHVSAQARTVRNSRGEEAQGIQDGPST